MSPLLRNGLIVLAVLVISIWAIVPPERKLRLGKDLAGGASLIYSVAVRPDDESGVLARVQTVVKERLDPQGLLEISVVPQGADRLEITMPLPGEDVKRQRAEFDKTLASFTAVNISEDEFESVARRAPEARTEWIAAKAGADAAMAERLRSAFRDFDAAALGQEKVSKALSDERVLQEQIRTAGVPETDATVVNLKTALEAAKANTSLAVDEAAKANIALETSRAAALSVGLSGADLERALSLDNTPIRLREEKTKTVVERDSPRAAAIKALEERYPQDKDKIEQVVKSWNDYQSKRRSLDDPEDIVRILRGAGVLNFRIAARPFEVPEENDLRAMLRDKGPLALPPDSQVRWYKINKVERQVDSVEELDALRASPGAFYANRGMVAEDYKGTPYVLLWDRPGMRFTEADGAVAAANPDLDEIGRPCIAFRMDVRGANNLGDMTSRNRERAMAVLFDDEVYTAPVLQSRISNSGRITGTFSQADIDYIVRVLGSGSLQAKLSPSPISKSVLGPQLGAENLRQGLNAGVIAFIVVGVFMIIYYFWCGAIAMVALLLNALMILAAMALNHAAFTLPGIAGVILTFGMAVDANVLVYERMREEHEKGADHKTAFRLGYNKALSAIVDGNVTTLIVCVVLGFMGTQEIRGFALTLGIGTVTTLFAQLFATRFIFTFLIEKFRWSNFTTLAMVNDGWLSKRLIPNVDWMKLRFVTLGISIALTGIGIFFVAYEGKDLLGTEFNGGTSMTLVFKEGPDGQREKATRGQVEDTVRQLAEGRAETDPLSALGNAEIIAVNPDSDNVTSSTFTVKTAMTDSDLLQKTLVGAFQDKLDTHAALTFGGSDDIARLEAYPLTSTILGDSIDRDGARQSVPDYRGGVAVVLENISPAVTKAELQQRLADARRRGGVGESARREATVVVLDGTDQAVRSAAVLVRDPNLSYFDDAGRWEREVRDRERNLIGQAYTTAQTQAEVQSFSAGVAATFRDQAVISVLLSSILIAMYIWVRFNAARYSMAAIITTLHDCMVAIGFIGLAPVLYRNFPNFSAAIGIMPFKIDLNVMAAVLTILGYSLNDTVIVMDRIREHRGKMAYPTRQVINDAINHTFSRTIITSGLTFLATIVLYIYGGEGVRVFAYTMLVGILIGTYSSVAVAAPLVWVRKADPTADSKSRMGDRPDPALAA